MQTWIKFKGDRLKAYINKGMKSKSALKKIGAEWQEYKKKNMKKESKTKTKKK